MRRKVTVALIALIVFLAPAIVLVATGADAGPPRLSSSQQPSPGPPVVSDGTREADGALEQINWALRDHGCQLGVEVRVNGAGQLEPRIKVEFVHRVLVTPS